MAQFGKRIIIPSEYMSQAILEKMRGHEEVKYMLERVNIYDFAFEPLPTYPSLVIEFLSTYCLRVQFINDCNPLNSMRFRLCGRDRFLTSQ